MGTQAPLMAAVRATARRIRTFAFRVLCEIAGTLGTYGNAISRFGGRMERWAAQRRDQP